MAKDNICACDLDRFITIQAVTETRSATGDIVSTWATIATVRAQLVFDRNTDGTEGNEGPGEQARVTQKFRIRWRAGVTNKHRVLYTPYGGAAVETYDILSVQMIGRRKWLEILARAKVL